MFRPLNGTAISPSVDAGKILAVTRNDARLTSSPIAIPEGGVMVTLN